MCIFALRNTKRWSDGRVARHRSAKPATAVRIRFGPQKTPSEYFWRGFSLKLSDICPTRCAFSLSLRLFIRLCRVRSALSQTLCLTFFPHIFPTMGLYNQITFNFCKSPLIKSINSKLLLGFTQKEPTRGK